MINYLPVSGDPNAFLCHLDEKQSPSGHGDESTVNVSISDRGVLYRTGCTCAGLCVEHEFTSHQR